MNRKKGSASPLQRVTGYGEPLRSNALSKHRLKVYSSTSMTYFRSLRKDGNKYVLVAIDYISKWVEAYAIPNPEAPIVTEMLVKKLLSRFGVPFRPRPEFR